MLQWHQHHRKFIQKDLAGQPRIHINALLIMSSAIMIEGAISSLLLFYLNGPFSPFLSAIKINSPDNLLNERNKELLISKVSSATWSEYKKLFKVVTGKSLPELTQPHWENTTFLFQFRNLLAHGEQINIISQWDRSKGLKLSDLNRNKNNLFQHLEEMGFIEEAKFGKYLRWSFLSDEVADHFVATARSFLSTLATNTPDSSSEETFPKRMAEILKLTELSEENSNMLFYTSGNNA